MFESKKQRILYAFLMAFLMSGFISLFMSLLSLGLHSTVIPIWIKSWAMEFFIVFPLILILAPIAKSLVLTISGRKSHVATHKS